MTSVENVGKFPTTRLIGKRIIHKSCSGMTTDNTFWVPIVNLSVEKKKKGVMRHEKRVRTGELKINGIIWLSF